MAEFNSPLGNKKIQNQGFRQIDVPDESNFEERHYNIGTVDPQAMMEFQSKLSSNEDVELEKKFAAMKEAKRLGKERLSDGARQRIEMLIGMTRLTREVRIDDNIFVLQTLRSKELRSAIVAAAEFDGNVQFSFETAKQLLGRSLIKVAGVPIEQFINSNELQDKLDFIEELPQALFTRLYNEYNIMDKEARDKYSIQTPESAKELISDLKK